MQEHRTESLVLKDQNGNFYAIPTDLLEKLRVPEEHKPAVEAALGDVSGYGGPLILAGVLAVVVAAGTAASEAYLNYEVKWYATR